MSPAAPTREKRGGRAPARALALLDAALEATADGLLVVDERGRIERCNGRLLELWRLPRAAAAGGAWRLLRRALPRLRDPAGFVRRVREVARDPRARPCDLVELADGRVLESRAHPLRLGRRTAGLVWRFTDVTGSRLAGERLRESEERYALAARGASDGLWDWDLVSGRALFSLRWKAMLGYGERGVRAEVEGWLELLHPADAGRVRAALAAHVEGRTPHFESEHRTRRADGSWCRTRVRGVAVRDAAGRATRMGGSQTDVGDRHAAEALLLHHALHDAVTGLPNRALFLDRVRLAQRRARAGGGDAGPAVLVLDVDHFQVVNDSLGHAGGDELIQAVARRLDAALRPGGTVARLGGGRFALLLEDGGDARTAQRAAERLRAELAAPFGVGEHEVYVGASIGIALAGPAAAPEEVLRDADLALFRAKEGGGGRSQLFDAGMHTRAMARLRTETELRRGIGRGELVVRYQPIVSLESGAVAAFEALVRWRHPLRGLLAPGEFIPLAEQTGLIGSLGSQVLRQACRQAREWQRRHPRHPALGVSVNLSARQLRPGLVETVADALAEAGLAPESLELEITESLLMDDADLAAAMLGELRALGVRLALDDFGTGFSSLAHLHRFPIDTLKIDRGFVSRLGQDDGADAIVRTVLALSEVLRLRTVAEGVETPFQRRRLRELGCTWGQGYAFAPPLDATAAERLLRQGDEAGSDAGALVLAGSGAG